MKQSIIVLISIFCISFMHEVTGQYNITGRVFNDNDEPLIGASVFLRNSDFATITDDSGSFSFEGILDPYQILVCTHLGYNRYLEYLDLEGDININIFMEGFSFDLNAVEITSNRLEDDNPYPYEVITDNDIEDLNLAQDIPFLLQYTPSVVVTSDAGAGIGYTGLRIRGSDPTRVNVTINGVPLNDSESQTVFWVDLPDFGSSVADLQIQRGVGTSTNGTGAFGGTIALNSHQTFQNEYVELNASYGSFNTQKVNVKLGSGLLNNSIFIDGRFSFLNSNGFIDRASSELRSYYFTFGKINPKSTIRFEYFSGTEVTYQAWNGVPESVYNKDQAAIQNHYNANVGGLYFTPQDSTNLFQASDTYNYFLYEDQIDRYNQNHFQLHWNTNSNENVQTGITLHYTKGLGYFEQFEYDQSLEDYGLNGIQDTIDGQEIVSTNLIRRRWLDNDFFGGIGNVKFKATEDLNVHIGTAYNYYIGDHFGRLVNWEARSLVDLDRDYYNNQGKKSDFNIFVKADYSIGKLTVFGDVQYRSVGYKIDGLDNDRLFKRIDDKLSFINPKVGFTYSFSDSFQSYASFAIGNREPDRNDYIDKPEGELPLAEQLMDYELGFRSKMKDLSFAMNLYYMDYKDQLVINGALNDVGSALRTNVPESYRLGLELQGIWRPIEKLAFDLNATLSRNKIENFTEIIYDYTTGFEVLENTYQDTDIALSPSIIGAFGVSVYPIKDLGITLQSKYVSDQYLDNTSNAERKLDAYFLGNILASYELKYKKLDHIRINLMVNNLLNTRYASNGYTYSYVFGEMITENFLYPQAGINFLLGLSVRI